MGQGRERLMSWLPSGAGRWSPGKKSRTCQGRVPELDAVCVCLGKKCVGENDEMERVTTVKTIFLLHSFAQGQP